MHNQNLLKLFQITKALGVDRSLPSPFNEDMILYLLSIFLMHSLFASFFYPNSYEESHERLEKYVQEKIEMFPKMQKLNLVIPTETETKLTIDTVYFPQDGPIKERFLIITSGTHGVEGFTGAAIQHAFLDNLKPEWLKSMGVLIVHAVNPYGFHFKRRVTEHNIDLNRNFSGTAQLFASHNEAYANFDDFLNPKKPLHVSGFQQVLLFAKSLWKLARYGKKELTQIVVGGQYQKPKGVYFGGHEHEIHVSIIKNEFTRLGEGYQKILHIDLHTGFGERGHLHFFTNRKSTQLEGFAELFKGFHLDLGEDKDFYETTGSFEEFTVQTFADRTVIPMTFEFGTMDSQTILGGFLSLKNMIYENQGFQFGYVDDQSREKTERDFLEMFNPSEPAWREKAVKDGAEALSTLVERFIVL